MTDGQIALTNLYDRRDISACRRPSREGDRLLDCRGLQGMDKCIYVI